MLFSWLVGVIYSIADGFKHTVMTANGKFKPSPKQQIKAINHEFFVVTLYGSRRLVSSCCLLMLPSFTFEALICHSKQSTDAGKILPTQPPM